jgi:hypothetical protein
VSSQSTHSADQQPVEEMVVPDGEHGERVPSVANGVVAIEGSGLTVVDGNGLGVGMTGATLTPALPISVESSGIPARAVPLGETDGTAVDDDALLLELVTHGPEVAELPGRDVPEPIAIPPPSNVAPEPDVPDDGLPVTEHVVPLPVIPIVVVPVGGGLSPGEASSVEPSGIPIGATGDPGTMPSGEVASRPGIGLTICCAKTGLQPKSAPSNAAINAHRILVSIFRTQQLRSARQRRASRSTSLISSI